MAATPELRSTGSGIAVTSFTVAVDRHYSKDSERQTDWIDCVAWRNTAEFVCKYFEKGSPIALSGYLTSRNWEKDGIKRKTLEVIVEEVEFTPRSRESISQNSKAAELAPAVEIGNAEDFEPVSGEDLPF